MINMNNINLNSPEWCELIFNGKNKDYGAYELRKNSSGRHIRALIIVAIGAILVMTIPVLIKSVIPQHAKEQVLEVTTLSNLQMETKVPEENQIRNLEAPPPPVLKSTIKFTPPGIKADKDVREEEEIKTQEELTTSKLAISVADVKGSESEDAIDIADLKDNKEVIEEETEPYVAVEQMPQFPGGNEALLKFISTHLRYPVIAAENGIQGTVTLRFVVSPTGEITKVEVLRQLDPACDKEALRVIKSLPQWVPGKQNGKPVPVYFTVPVRFKLQ